LRRVADELKDPFLGPHAEKHQQGFALVFFTLVDGEMRFQVQQVVIHRAGHKPYAIVAGTVFR